MRAHGTQTVVSRACPPSLRPRLGSPVPGPAHWPVVRMREQARGPDVEAVGVGKSRRSAGTGSPVPGVAWRNVTARCAEYRVCRSTPSLGHWPGVARSVSARQGHDRFDDDDVVAAGGDVVVACVARLAGGFFIRFRVSSAGDEARVSAGGHSRAACTCFSSHVSMSSRDGCLGLSFITRSAHLRRRYRGSLATVLRFSVL